MADEQSNAKPAGQTLFRLAQARDAMRICAIMRAAILSAGPGFYDAHQVNVWSGFADLPETLTRIVNSGITWVAYQSQPGSADLYNDFDNVVGFVRVEPPGHIDMLYVDPLFHRHGIGAALLRQVDSYAIAAGVAELHTEASLIATPLFTRRGFQMDEWEEVERRGAVFRRARMSKKILHEPGRNE